jgi:nucleotide-binding universal stress UspA family protein
MKTPSIRNILVSIDFSSMSIQAIETAQRLAQRFEAKVHLVHIHHWQYPAGFMGPVSSRDLPPMTFEEHRKKTLAEDLKKLARRCGLSLAEAIHLREGASTFDEICRTAQEIPADLIVLPTHGRTGLKHVFLGSTAERIVQHSPCPVFVIRESEKAAGERIDKILVPVDFSSCSLEGLNYAIRWAEKVAARILILNVVDLGVALTSDGYAMYDLSKYREAAGKEAERQMRKFVRLVKFGGVKFETAVVTGPPVDEICAFAQSQDVDLIITSTHGRTGFEHVLIGSTAEKVVRYAQHPVLVVPSHPKIRQANLRRSAKPARRTHRQTVIRKGRRFSSEMQNLSRRNGKLRKHAFPERRKTNKARETYRAR